MLSVRGNTEGVSSAPTPLFVDCASHDSDHRVPSTREIIIGCNGHRAIDALVLKIRFIPAGFGRYTVCIAAV